MISNNNPEQDSNKSTTSKSFKINLDNNDYNKLMNIINKDNEFIKGKCHSNYNFLVFEKNSQNMEIYFDENKENDGQQINKTKVPQFLKKYLFKASQDNFYYSIAIVDYFGNNI